MAGIIGIYGLIVSVIIGSIIQNKVPTWNADKNIGYNTYTAYGGFAHLGAGLVVGISGLAAGMAIGIVGDAGTRAIGQQPSLFSKLAHPYFRRGSCSVWFDCSTYHARLRQYERRCLQG